MEFFLPFKIKPFPFNISYQDKILFIGSCFSEEIANKLEELKFDILQNPNGILYDPLSISESLDSYIENKVYREEDIFELNGLWHSWKHHSVFSGENKNDVLHRINQSQNAAHQFIEKATFIFITLGTAFHYELNMNQQNVANCHKAPSILFQKKLLSEEVIIHKLAVALNAIQLLNPGLKIIFTISPVKHVKDGVAENNRSKARLIEAVHSIIDLREDTFYFPSYELVTDILRDYRFYKNDLVHPNETAVNFVFEKFKESFLNASSKKIAEEIKKIITAINHKPFAKESEAHLKFIASQLTYIQKLENEYPFLNFKKEKEILSGY
ncbi:MAG: GSCFA domain-containing protein [Bacteroidota bacterium]|nr:GSCFA domain-containing protein [Bacteroidota bacterium]